MGEKMILNLMIHKVWLADVTANSTHLFGPYFHIQGYSSLYTMRILTKMRMQVLNSSLFFLLAAKSDADYGRPVLSCCFDDGD